MKKGTMNISDAQLEEKKVVAVGVEEEILMANKIACEGNDLEEMICDIDRKINLLICALVRMEGEKELIFIMKNSIPVNLLPYAPRAGAEKIKRMEDKQYQHVGNFDMDERGIVEGLPAKFNVDLHDCFKILFVNDGNLTITQTLASGEKRHSNVCFIGFNILFVCKEHMEDLANKLHAKNVIGTNLWDYVDIYDGK